MHTPQKSQQCSIDDDDDDVSEVKIMRIIEMIYDGLW